MTVPFYAIRSWQALSETSPLGEAIVQIQVVPREGGEQHTFVVAVNPRSHYICRAWRLSHVGAPEVVYTDTLPYHITDLAQTVVRERWPGR